MPPLSGHTDALANGFVLLSYAALKQLGSRRAALVAMVQSADLSELDDLARRRRLNVTHSRDPAGKEWVSASRMTAAAHGPKEDTTMAGSKLPKYDMTDSPTGCCPRFDPGPWDGLEVEFDNKLFVKGKTRSIFHIPLNMAGMMKRTMKAIQDADAFPDSFLLLSHDPSPWRGEHYFAVSKEVPGTEMTRLSGKYLTKAFEGPFKDTPKWMQQLHEHVAANGKTAKKLYLFYTTCPKCIRYYGKNHVIGFAEIA